MKFIEADLLESVGNTYDQTRTTTQGRITQKTIDGEAVLGPPLNSFIDVIADTGVTPAGAVYATSNGRIFSITAETGGLASLMLHTVNYDTGSTSYVGRIQFALADTAATTHTYRAIKAIDTGTTGWKIFVITTGSVLINGGVYLINNVDLADFVPIGFPTISFASGNNQKAVYLLQDPAAIGVGQLNTASAGAVLDTANNRLYVHNGVAATHQYYVYATDTSPTYSTTSITGNATTDVVSHAGHTFLDNDPIVFSNLVGGAGITAGTVYFVRNVVPGVSYQISTTTGGAAFNFTSDITSALVGRAFGTTGSNFVHKTGNLPALTGTLLLTDSEDYAVPQHTTNAGFPCAFFATSSQLYLGRLSELTSGATSWPSLVTANLLGTTNQITAPTATYAAWSNALDRGVYLTNASLFVMKRVANNEIDVIFGGLNNRYFEGFPSTNVVELGAVSVGGVDLEQGYLFVMGATAGQRGIYIADLRSDALFDYSFIVTKVLDTPSSTLSFITTLDKLYDFTGSLEIYYRTSGFGSIAGGWTLLPFAEDLSGFAAGQQIQFKITFSQLSLDTCIPAQLYEFILGFESVNAISDNWEYSHDDSTPGNPSRVAFRLKKAYETSVPTLYFRAYDLSDSQVVNHNTSAQSSRFRYSTDGGVNWITLGTIPNVVGTLVRYEFSTPPGVSVRPSLRES